MKLYIAGTDVHGEHRASTISTPMQGDLQKHLLTGDSRRAWEQWSSHTIELKVVRTEAFMQPLHMHGTSRLTVTLPCHTLVVTHASCHTCPSYPESAGFEPRCCMQVPALAAVLAVLYGVWQWVRSRQRVFLLDFACYKPPENLKVSLDDFMTGSRESGVCCSSPFCSAFPDCTIFSSSPPLVALLKGEAMSSHEACMQALLLWISALFPPLSKGNALYALLQLTPQALRLSADVDW